MEEFWHTDPWGAVEKDGRIYGRGTQDMKSVLMQYLLALGRLHRRAVAAGKGDAPLFRRNLFVTLVPDEEIGGKEGLGALIDSGLFDRLCPNVAVALDEGLATPQAGSNTVFFGERLPVWVLVTANGPTGHGSRFIKGTATEKLITVANQAFAKRREQESLLGWGSAGEQAGCAHCEAKKLGDVLTINLTMLQAGVSADGGKTFSINVIPNKAVAGFDIRVPITMPLPEVKAMLDTWCAEEGLSWTVDPKTGKFEDFRHAVTSIDPATNKWWRCFSAACDRANIKVVPEIFPAGTDSRFLRMKGVSAFGFSPMSGSQIMLHEHNEYLERDTFLKGIAIYEALLPDLANFTV
jgi:aminoacylase